MSRSRIRWIVALMAVGLLGLVALQVYWIGSALQLQREQFTYKVTDALQEVVRTLERQEILYLTRQRVEARNQQSRLMAIAKKPDASPARGSEAKPTDPFVSKLRSTDPLARVTSSKAALAHGRPTDFAPAGALVVESDVLHPMAHPLSAEQMLVVEAFFRQQEELTATGDWPAQIQQQQAFERWVDNVLTSELSQINHQQDSLARAKRLRPSARRATVTALPVKATPVVTGSAAVGQRRAEEQTRMIKDVLKGLLLSDRPIEERVNRMTLDTLLRQALQERGISIPFAYGVRTKAKPQFLFTSLGAPAGAVATNGYKAVLFPNNLLETGNYVYVYFPTQEQFILSRLAFTFGASAVLLLVILACFYIAISTIVRQKKLADIKNDFINNMTHEFKTPISTISLAVEMAQEGLRGPTAERGPAEPTGESAGRLMRYMNIIRDETRRLGSHVEKVLQMALLDRGEIRLNLSAVSVHDVIENVLNAIGLQIEQRGGDVDLDFEADRDVVEADEVHLTNIVYNLVDNAIKYSPDSPHITLRTRSLPEGVQITVADQGLGMTKEQVSRIFEKFYRVPTGNRHDVKGFGLGLSYVKKMVDEHHGQITVHSQPGKGSSFEIFIPYKMSD